MSVTSPKKPLDLDKHIGLEIELLSPFKRSKVISILNKSPLKNNIQVKNDGSIQRSALNERYICRNCTHNCDNHIHANGAVRCHICNNVIAKSNEESSAIEPHELNIIFKEKDLVKTMKQLSSLLKELKAQVNKSCGLHVHIDMRQRSPYTCFANLVKAQDYLFTLVKKERMNNIYCKKVKADAELNSPVDRHSTINPNALLEHGTIEIRMHHGTTDVKEIYWWIKNLICVAEGKKPGVLITKYAKKQSEAMKKAS